MCAVIRGNANKTVLPEKLRGGAILQVKLQFWNKAESNISWTIRLPDLQIQFPQKQRQKKMKEN